MHRPSRRNFLASASLASLAAAPTLGAAAEPHAKDRHAGKAGSTRPAPAAASRPDGVAPHVFLNAAEAAFLDAATARLIPTDENGPGAREAGVLVYIDRQLGGAWGAGERLYRSGPWSTGTPMQGYQLPFTPAELFRTAMRALRERDAATVTPPFEKRSAAEQDRFLSALQDSDQDLGGVPGKVFFASLLELTIEGFFSDPVYGGNRDMIAWQLIGFPGAYANYYHLVDQHGMSFDRRPVSLGEDGGGHVQLLPVNIPVRAPRGR